MYQLLIHKWIIRFKLNTSLEKPDTFHLKYNKLFLSGNFLIEHLSQSFKLQVFIKISKKLLTMNAAYK